MMAQQVLSILLGGRNTASNSDFTPLLHFRELKL